MKLMIVDGNSILNRAFYAIRPLSAPDGTPTNAIFGFLNIFHKYFTEEKPDAVAVCFDVARKTFRNDIFPDYKGTRKPMPDDLRAQLPIIKELLSLLGYCVLGLEGYEADDLIGTLSTAASERKQNSVIITGDRDSLQLVDEHTTVLLPSTRAGKTETTVYTPEDVLEKMGVRPDRIVDLKALMGDSSDNIPGVAGIGEKTAVELLSKFDSVENLYKELETAELRPAVKAKLQSGRESAFLSRTLATINRQVPIDTNPEVYKIREMDRSGAASLLTRLKLTSAMRQYSLSADDAKLNAAAEPRESVQIPSKNYTLVRSASAADIENAAAGEPIYYFMRSGLIYAAAGKSLFISSDIKGIFELPHNKYTYDCKSQYLYAFQNGISLANITFDLKLAAYLLEPTALSYELSELTARYGSSGSLCNHAPEFGDDEEAISEIRELPYLCESLKVRLENQDMLSLLSDIEIPLSETLSAMEFEGFSVDSKGLSAFDRELSALLEGSRKRVYELAGEEFNLNSPKQLGEILFERLGLPSKKKTKTGYSTNAEVLESLKNEHPIINEILSFRKVSKLKSTYTEGLIHKIADDGRIHTTFLQTETRTGRLSSIEPNLQNIPVRTQLGSRLREFFVAKEGCVLVDADYSQIELRVLSHVANDRAMQEAFKSGADIHAATAARIHSLPLDMVTPEIRRSAKAVNFGIVYGIGAYSLSQDIGTSVAEANRLIKSYLNSYSGVAEYMKATVENGEKNGFVKTLYGRRRAIPELSSKNKVLHALGERVAMNTPIQGTAADIIKIAMNRVYARLKRDLPEARLILQVHDELIVECPEKDAETAAKLLKEEMEAAATLKVTLESDVHIGKNWLTSKG
ncbi:MAG: DNA polymerase I [Oscillospiraceae bacterium]|nr:DNA polymerase I [Oscillospiraceae bacterium]